ncbi:MAG: hypothetical protein Q9211_001824 [Gyalolechia sp. 1 TL-2023]
MSHSKENNKRLRMMQDDRRVSNDEAKLARKKVKLAVSFDAKYWLARRDLAKHELKSTKLSSKISTETLHTTTDAFLATEEGKMLILRENSLETDLEMYENQVKRMENAPKGFSIRQSFVGLFIGAPTGLRLRNSYGPRDDCRQQQFKEDLTVRYESRHPDPDKTLLWCPITSMYWAQSSMVAAHLFPSKCGDTYMDAIFGVARDDQGNSELFKPENGLLWSREVEQRFEACHFVIVPQIIDNLTPEKLQEWERAEVKEYQIRILNPNEPAMKEKVLDTETRWTDLEGRPVNFKEGSIFRPRARYLYFRYCAAMLRRSFAGKHESVSRSEVRKRFWGTPGKYMRESMLLGFVETMGHDYDHLMEGAIKEEDPITDIRAVDLANDRIKEVLEPTKEERDHYDSDEDSDDEDNGNISEDGAPE